MDTRIFVDANVPMYAHGASHTYRQPCQASLQRITAENIPVVTSSEVVQEIIHRYLSLRRPRQAVQVASDFMTVVPSVLPATQSDIEYVLRLIPSYPGLSARDLLHVAVMLNNDIAQILSADAHFDQVEEVDRLDPASFAAQ
ncbi:MAG: hypothetical protein B6I35_03540 [Anaerolineaceae bacterium 4572_32.2]|nr:MAG: hypothetical protein B6I35_03540 [Anaerolineaceae bacterium 4572_32.2]HEY71739.1 type II toxin-antitoxin system VapC family toxin [Thermoflexia bacterium]